ncbi:flavin-dependent dehydrogenase [Actinophytocola oryzae]|uniref:Flavin-dependent dehydrogenase n=2 Tax=Actinophytocola oryzae TaxID=502181 RepID=A0A4R7VKJ4_9PSEU|nr:flavin-dependent dehydrogenase [Actinophytocola oryzae]
MLAAKAGLRVLLLDRARFPSDTVSTHLIHQPGVALLARWGVLDAVVATGCPPIESAGYRLAGTTLRGRSEAVDGQAAAYAPRRYLLDEILADAAVSAGAEFVDRSTVVGLLRDEDGAVRGVRYRRGDALVEASASLVVGADGMRSTVARLAGAPTVVEDPTMTCVYYAYWRGLPAEFALYEEPGRFVGTIPTNDGLTVVAAYFPQVDFPKVRRDARAAYVTNIGDTVPGLAAVRVDDERFDRLHGFGAQRNFFRQAAGRGWVLTGDAAHHKDSITARGISDAFVQAELLARQVLPAVTDPRALRDSLAAYAELRDDALAESYYTTLSVARLEVRDDRVELLRGISGDQRMVDQYFSVVSGARSVEDVFARHVPMLSPLH